MHAQATRCIQMFENDELDEEVEKGRGDEQNATNIQNPRTKETKLCQRKFWQKSKNPSREVCR